MNSRQRRRLRRFSERAWRLCDLTGAEPAIHFTIPYSPKTISTPTLDQIACADDDSSNGEVIWNGAQCTLAQFDDNPASE